jgi:hypothetical protein
MFKLEYLSLVIASVGKIFDPAGHVFLIWISMRLVKACGTYRWTQLLKTARPCKYKNNVRKPN